uniref:Sulfatase-modifying factor enzyme-like domain-containing protein n=1 Tax=Mucochytrium quahogii TaxID=96639 RepID=A0A7S2RS12_9STRA|mmetsp:Transcript_13971/g.24713  ORF Transcript_13971/g.24713 Transcript_13971/m.24713 type:complete len:749 (+) Transcript_13971:57-2303(+)
MYTKWLVVPSFCCLCVTAWPAQPADFELLPVPSNVSDPGVITAWRSQWGQWKKSALELAKYDKDDKGNGYNIEGLKWTQSSFVQPQLLMHDRLIYDRKKNKYTVEKYVKTMHKRYGGIDSVLLWTSYPNAGIDSRNQFQWLESLPGDLSQVIKEFHKFGVKVFLPYNPWDTGTADEPGMEGEVRMYAADIQKIYELKDSLGLDGLNGDTMHGVPMEFFKSDQPLAMCPEGGVPIEWLATNTMSWAYWDWQEGKPPPVSRAKFLEPRHMSIVCNRWSLDRIRDIQLAFFNGVGYETWENVWGIYIAMSKRADAAVKRVYTILRYFAKEVTSGYWQPYAKMLNPPSSAIFASSFTENDASSILWTVVKDSKNAAKAILQVDIEPEFVFIDIYHGMMLTPSCKYNTCNVTFPIEGKGFGAVLGVNKYKWEKQEKQRKLLKAFMKHMRHLTSKKLQDISNHVGIVKQYLVGWNQADKEKYMTNRKVPPVVRNSTEKNMVLVPGSRSWNFVVNGTMIEPVPAWTPDGRDTFGVGVQFPWESRPWYNHSKTLRIPPFYIDEQLVTNDEFNDFLKEAKYTPRDQTNFVKHWKTAFEPTKPVVWVSREDAHAFCKHNKKRLPHDFEWQYAASNGTSQLLYPWGNNPPNTTNMPQPYYGKSPLSIPESARDGCRGKLCDMVGRVWQMTDSFCDEHTCGQLLRGGSFYRPQPSTLFDPNWYFPQAYANNLHSKFITLSESYDRSGTVGFRCVKDYHKQ